MIARAICGNVLHCGADVAEQWGESWLSEKQSKEFPSIACLDMLPEAVMESAYWAIHAARLYESERWADAARATDWSWAWAEEWIDETRKKERRLQIKDFRNVIMGETK